MRKIPREDWPKIVKRWRARPTKKTRSEELKLMAQEYKVTAASIYYVLYSSGGYFSDPPPVVSKINPFQERPTAVQASPFKHPDVVESAPAVKLNRALALRGRSQPHYAPLRFAQGD